MATLTIQEIPIGSQYTQSIGTDDPKVSTISQCVLSLARMYQA